ncbi:hypothetical protein L2E82_00766 [Cichorium intybus]|uniref:Uncharacterized protein n=1 Tax=Cichorium intybus TaxID=13427 RepID=A0ACB9GXP6_CICIN|nr:hypothetical protein L2E82_00766 [Cichorium intybus]
MDTSSLDFIISMGTSQDFPGDKLFEEFSRVLKPGGEIFIHQTLDFAKENVEMAIYSRMHFRDTLYGQNQASLMNYFPNFDEPFEEFIYPKGDVDAVSISKRDVDLLLSDTFVNDTIIDFYINYLADQDKDPFDALEGKTNVQRVKKWTRKVNIFEKDFVFIPVNYNHSGFIKGLMHSYLKEEWKGRQQEAYEDMASRFDNMRFISLELPQQPNSFDCGLFLLHYVELFLEQAPINFNPFKITKSVNFTMAKHEFIGKFDSPTW